MDVTHPVLSPFKIRARLAIGTLRVAGDGSLELQCTGPCGQWLPADGEHFGLSARDGLTSKCRACLRGYYCERRASERAAQQAGGCPLLCRYWQIRGRAKCVRGHCRSMAA